jgi:hypothetical protein
MKTLHEEKNYLMPEVTSVACDPGRKHLFNRYLTGLSPKNLLISMPNLILCRL